MNFGLKGTVSKSRMAEANVPPSDIEMNGADEPHTRLTGVYPSGSTIPLESMMDITQRIDRLDMGRRLSKGEVIMVITSGFAVTVLTCAAVVITILKPRF